MKSSAPTACAAARISRVGGVGAAEGDVLPDGAAEQESLLGHDPHLRAQRLRGHRTQVVAVDLARSPRSGRRSGQTSLANVDLPAPVSPTSATSAPAGSTRSMSCSAHGASSIGPVAERDVVEAELAPDPRQLDRVRGVDQVGLLGEQLEDLVERRHPGLVGRVELRELLDRIEEVVERGDEREHDAGRWCGR